MTIGTKTRVIFHQFDYPNLVVECLKSGPKKRSEIKEFLDTEIPKRVRRTKEKDDKAYRVTERSISRYLKELEDIGIIGAVTKKGPYFLTINTIKSPKFAAEILLDFSKIKLFPNMQSYNYARSGNEDTLSRYIKQFSNTIGAYFTYLLIQSLNPSNPYIRKSKSDDVQNEESAIDWIKNGFSLQEIIHQFILQMPNTGSKQPRLEQMLKKSLTHKYAIDRDTAKALLSAFRDGYPDLSPDMDSALEAAEKEIDNRLRAIKLIKKRY